MLARLNSRQARPTVANQASRVLQAWATAATISSASTSTAITRNGFSVRAAKPGARARMNMPSATGSTMITATSTTLRIGGGTYWPEPKKYSSERLRISGRVSRHSTLLIAVRVMLSATSPRARWL